MFIDKKPANLESQYNTQVPRGRLFYRVQNAASQRVSVFRWRQVTTIDVANVPDVSIAVTSTFSHCG